MLWSSWSYLLYKNKAGFHPRNNRYYIKYKEQESLDTNIWTFKTILFLGDKRRGTDLKVFLSFWIHFHFCFLYNIKRFQNFPFDHQVELWKSLSQDQEAILLWDPNVLQFFKKGEMKDDILLPYWFWPKSHHLLSTDLFLSSLHFTLPILYKLPWITTETLTKH